MKKKAETIEQFKILQKSGGKAHGFNRGSMSKWIEKTFQEDVICEIEWTSKTTAKLTDKAGDTLNVEYKNNTVLMC